MIATSTNIIRTAGIILMLLVQTSMVEVAYAATDNINEQQLLQRIEANTAPLVLDVRRPDEYAASHVPAAINIPHTELEKRLNELKGYQDKEIVVYCESGRRAAIAQDILSRAGFKHLLHLEGDMKAWRERSLPTDTGNGQPALKP